MPIGIENFCFSLNALKNIASLIVKGDVEFVLVYSVGTQHLLIKSAVPSFVTHCFSILFNE